MSFVHLSLHTEFSLKDSLIRIKPLMKHLKEQGAQAVALTDMGNLFAAIKFYKAAKEAGIKPILGADCYLKHAQLSDHSAGRVRLLALNNQGYTNLSILLSKGYRDGQILGVPHLDVEWLKDYQEGLILIAGQDSGLGEALIHDRKKDVNTWLDVFECFNDRFYLGLARLGKPQEVVYEEALLALAAREDLPVVAMNDVCFLDKKDFEAHEVRSCIANAWIFSDQKRPKKYTEEQYLKTPQQMAELFADLPEVIENTVEISKRCTTFLSLGKAFLPDFPVPDGMTMDDYFRHLSQKGLHERFEQMHLSEEDKDRYLQRLDVELTVIIQMGFPGYFLIVADFIQWAKDHNIPVGPGRGSGAGSLVAWALKITDIDPLPYDLLFERFLNPERVSMPDFDIDFCMDGRDRVIEYVTQRYGRESVSQIATHGTMAAKAVVRDVGRALGHPYGFVDRIAKLIPNTIGISLTEALEEADLKSLYQSDEEVKGIIDFALRLEGLTRSVGRHAGGVVISPTLLTDFSPLYCEEGSTALVTQFDKDDVESAGLVKFDFLGLRTLTIIQTALQNVQKSQEKTIDILQIPLDDKATFQLLKRCETTAVFQLESRGMKDLVRRLQPDIFEDIIALVALFRPGPLESGMVDDFINRKHGRAKTEYAFAELEPVLSPTYGVIVYQEQVMQISQIIGNYTLGGADLLRRAMGKKKPEEMAKQRVIFMEGAKSLNFDAQKAGELFDLMEKFAGYGFNKSHSAAYALVAYQTAYLKAHYPAEFMAAVLSSDMDKTEKVVIFIEECREMKLPIASPNVNQSYYAFTVDSEGRIIYGLGAVKGVGEAALECLVLERSQNGVFKDLFDLCVRVDLSKVNKRALETLICSGAMDCFMSEERIVANLCQYRANLMHNLPEAMHRAEQESKNRMSGQTDLFGLFESETSDSDIFVSATLQATVPWSEADLLEAEKDVLGFYFTAHPIDRFKNELRKITTHSFVDLLEMEQPTRRLSRAQEPQAVLAGLLTKVRSKVNQLGKKMTYITIEDRVSSIELRLYDEHLDAMQTPLRVNQILVINGSLAWDDFTHRMQVRVQSLHDIDEIRRTKAKWLMLEVDKKTCNREQLLTLNTIMTDFKTEQGVHIMCQYSGDGGCINVLFGEKWMVEPTETLLSRLKTSLSDFKPRLSYEEPKFSGEI